MTKLPEEGKGQPRFKVPSISSRKLIKAIKSYGAVEMPCRGDGSHSMYKRVFENGSCSSPVPKSSDLDRETVRSIRRKLLLMPDAGVSDEEFYGRT